MIVLTSPTRALLGPPIKPQSLKTLQTHQMDYVTQKVGIIQIILFLCVLIFYVASCPNTKTEPQNTVLSVDADYQNTKISFLLCLVYYYIKTRFLANRPTNDYTLLLWPHAHHHTVSSIILFIQCFMLTRYCVFYEDIEQTEKLSSRSLICMSLI